MWSEDICAWVWLLSLVNANAPATSTVPSLVLAWFSVLDSGVSLFSVAPPGLAVAWVLIWFSDSADIVMFDALIP